MSLFESPWFVKMPIFASIFRYGCPSMEELESYSQEFKKRLDEVGELGKIPNNLALEVLNG
jgi:hypothetical protein